MESSYINEMLLDETGNYGLTGLIPETLIRHYIKHIEPINKLSPIIASIGEHWEGIPLSLQEALKNVPIFIHGYKLPISGLPKLKKALKSFVISSYQLEERHNNSDYTIAITSTGTKTFMHYFARYLLAKNKRTATAIIACPGWDYTMALRLAGFELAYLMLDDKKDFIPTIEDYQTIIKQYKNSHTVRLMVINTQNNPTGKNWPEKLVLELIDLAIKEDIAILLDDAHFAQVDYGAAQTISFRILLDRLLTMSSAKLNWLCVRSLGKQFGCSGWGLGIVISNKSCIDELINHYTMGITLGSYHAILQYALATYLESNEWQEYTKSLQIQLKEKRSMVRTFFHKQLGFPNELLPTSECTPFILFPIPGRYQNDSVLEIIKDVFFKTGVLLAPGSLLCMDQELSNKVRYLRLYIGMNKSSLQEVLNRFLKNNITYFKA